MALAKFEYGPWEISAGASTQELVRSSKNSAIIAKASPAEAEQFEDAKKEAIVKAEQNIDLFLNHHAYKVDKNRTTHRCRLCF